MIMKRILLTIAVLFATLASVSAMSLPEAYRALCNVPNMSQTEIPKTSSINYNSTADSIAIVGMASATSLDAAGILQTGNAVYTILNQVPLEYMINGANNNLVSAFIYATPTADNRYDCLMVLMSGYGGDVGIISMTCDKNIKEELQNAVVTMRGASLTIKSLKGSDIDIVIGTGL